jgi:hypothetical protein
LGRQDYLSLESKGLNIWSYTQNSDRWKVFRLNNLSHNTLTISNHLHNVNGHALITDFHGSPTPRATIDLSPVFSGDASRVTRQFEVSTNRVVLIRDELSGVAEGVEIRWAMVTKADIDLEGKRAILKQDGKELQAEVLSPTNATFAVIPTEHFQNQFDDPSPGARILSVVVAAPASGDLRIDVQLKPRSKADKN